MREGDAREGDARRRRNDDDDDDDDDREDEFGGVRRAVGAGEGTSDAREGGDGTRGAVVARRRGGDDGEGKARAAKAREDGGRTTAEA